MVTNSNLIMKIAQMDICSAARIKEYRHAICVLILKGGKDQ